MFRKQPKSFTIELATTKTGTELAPAFTVNIVHSTVLLDDADEFINAAKTGFKFTAADDHKSITISITPQEPFNEIDSLFRRACAMLTRHKLTSSESDAIIQAYDKHLRQHNVDSGFTIRKSQNSSNKLNSSNAF